MSIFQHRHAEIPDCKFVISPSQIPKFYDNPALWYQEELLGDRQFQGNVSTLLGTICHYIYECVTKGEEVTREFINKELFEHLAANPALADEVNVAEILNDYPLVTSAVVNEYILPRAKTCNSESEVTMAYKLKDGIFLAGTCDRITQEEDGSYTIVDFKTVGKKPSGLVISRNYKLQLMTYAYMLQKLKKVPVTKISIVFGIRPQKTIGARCLVMEEAITDEMWMDIENTINLISDSVELSWKEPKLNYLLFKNYELKVA